MANSPIPLIHRKATSGSRAALCVINRWLGRFEDKLLVIGEGRGGTTWLANLLNFDNHYRMLFEPFQAENFRPPISYQSEYPFPDSDGSDVVDRHIKKVIRGNFISGHANVRFPKALYRGLMIKDISAQLIIDQLCDSAPTMRRIMIVRHPFAVAVSKSKAFSWPTDPSTFLSGDNPRRAEIEGRRDIIDEVTATGDPILIQILLWCLSTRFALSSRSINSFTLVFYEDLITRPKHELPRIFSRLGLFGRYSENQQLIEEQLDHRSHVTFRNNVIEDSRKRRTAWHNEWDVKTIDAGLQILEGFGFQKVYSDSFSPLLDIDQLLSSMRQPNHNEDICHR
ncbi:MAG: sulfotransferase domain-containing protein [Woeseiaceae bacterium]|nr:sulfotransferase domain-containing protein [Woeseiaceae bacterium]